MFKIAWRNILRNKRRSTLSLAIIIIGVCVLYIFNGYKYNALDSLKKKATSTYGYLEIAAVGYWDSRSEDRKILAKTDLEKIKFLLSKNPVVKNFSSQLNVNGILANESKSIIICGVGLEPDKFVVTPINAPFLSKQDTDKSLLGEGVFDKLGVKQGDSVSILTTTLDGAQNAGSLQVLGAFGTDYDKISNEWITFPLGFAQSLLNTDGVDRVVVNFTDDKFTPSTIDQLKEDFHKAGLKVEVKDWMALDDYCRQATGMLQTVFGILSLIIFILVFFSVLEIMSMAFLERMNEIGTIQAIGTTRFRVFSMLCQEGLILGVIGGVIGLGLGYGCGYLINIIRITYAEPGGSTGEFYVNLGIQNGIRPFITVIVAIMIATLYPALKAARSNIVDILRHV
jgi:putative ABC transport system permease protein